MLVASFLDWEPLYMCYLYLCFPGWQNRVKNMLLGVHRDSLNIATLKWQQSKGEKVFPSPWKWDSSTPDGLEFRFSKQPLVKKFTVTFRAFAREFTSRNRQVLSFSSSCCHTGDRWKKIPGTPQCSKADSQSLWTHSLRAHQNPKSCPGHGSKWARNRLGQPEMLSPRYKSRRGWGWATFCFVLNRSSMWTQRHLSRGRVYGWSGLGVRLAAGQPAIQAQDVVREWKHSLPFSSHASLSLGPLMLRCCPLPRAEEKAVSVPVPLYSSSFAQQKARFKARFSAESTNLK